VLRRLPQRRVASLYDIAVQYATLDWYQTVTSGELDFDLDPKYLSLLTPMKKDELYGEPENALVIRVDLSDPTAPTFPEEEPVQLRTVGESLRYELGHSYPSNKTSSMTDYSLTTHKSASDHHLAGERDDAWGTANIRDRFTRWAHSEAADTVLDEFDGNTSILEGLRRLGEDEARLESLLDRDDFPLDPTEEENDREVFVTVRIKPPDEDSYQYPGNFSVLNEVMAEQKRDRFQSLNVKEASGEGTGYVTGETDTVTGGSTGLLEMYGKQQREHFPDLSADGAAAWRTRPITFETSAAVATANSVFESFYAPLGDSRRLYVLPYLRGPPSDLDAETVEAFERQVFDRLRTTEAGDFQERVRDVFFQRERPSSESDAPALFSEEAVGDLHDKVGVATVLVVSGNPSRVFFEHLDVDGYRPREFEQARKAVLSEPPFRTGTFAGVNEQVGSPLLDSGTNRTTQVFFGSDFTRTTEPTRSSRAVDDTPKAGDIDDVMTRHLDAFLGGESIPRPPLLDGYVHKLVQRQRELFGDDGQYEVPDADILEQYAQLRALEAIGAIRSGRRRSRDETSHWLTPTADSTAVTDSTHQTDNQTDEESRADQLEQFIDDHPVLADSDAHLSAFLLGGLVGRITATQKEIGVSSTLTRRYPIDYLTKQSVKEVTKEVLDMNETYIQSEDYSLGYNARYTDRLPDLMLKADPSDWTVSQSELQWVYALGIAYGKNDTSEDDEDEESSDETTDDAATTEEAT
jgi:hypothetical protein